MATPAKEKARPLQKAARRKPKAAPAEVAPAEVAPVEVAPVEVAHEAAEPAPAEVAPAGRVQVTRAELLEAARTLGHPDPAAFLASLPRPHWDDLAATAIALRPHGDELEARPHGDELEALILRGAAAPAGEAARYLARAAAIVRARKAD